AEAGRSTQLAGAALVDRRLGNSSNHLVGVAQLAYDTPSNFKTLDRAGVKRDVTVEHTVALRTGLGVSRETPTGSVGVAVHAVNGFGSSVMKDASNGSVLREAQLSLSSGEIFGTYNLNQETRLNGSLAKGF